MSLSTGPAALSQYPKFATLDEALKTAQQTKGNEAIFKHEENGNIFFTVQSIDANNATPFKQTELDPNLVCFSIEEMLNGVTVEKKILAQAVKIEQAFDNVLEKLGQSDTPELRNHIAEALGFKNFETLTRTFEVLNTTELNEMLLCLSNSENIKINPVTQKIDCQKLNQSMAHYLSQKLNELTGKEIRTEPKVQEWKAAGVMALFEAFNKLKANTPDQLDPAMNLTYVYSATPTELDVYKRDTPEENTLLEILSQGMYLAHTDNDGRVFIHDGAIHSNEKKLLDEQKSQMFSDKIEILRRPIYETAKNIGPDRVNGLGNHRLYRRHEMDARGLITKDNHFDRDKALLLFQKFTKSGPDNRQLFNQAYALISAVSRKNGDIMDLLPCLKGLVTFEGKSPNTEKLYGLLLASKSQQGLKFIEAIKNDLEKLLKSPPPTLTNDMLCHAVFKAEQITETQSLQQFLNQSNPESNNDLIIDGMQGKDTTQALECLQITIMAKIIENKLPTNASPVSHEKLKEVYQSLTKAPPEITSALSLIKQLTDEIFADPQYEDLQRILSQSVANINLGKFDQETVHSLIKSWFQMVDSNQEGAIGSDLLLHEIGHNIIHEKTEVHDGLPPEYPTLESDWVAIGGFDQFRTDFTLEAATRSFTEKGQEEVSDYGQTSADEDFAEAFRMFNANPKELLAQSPTKFLMLNAIVNHNPADAQKKLNDLLNVLQKEGRIKDRNVFLKPSLDKILGYDSNANSYVSPQMVAKMTSTYDIQFKGYTPPTDIQKKGAATVTPKVLTNQQVEDIKSAFTTLMKHIPAPVGAKFDEAKLKEILGAEKYDSLPGAFKAMLYEQECSKFLTELTLPPCSPDLMVQECDQRQALSSELTKDKLSDRVGGFKGALGMGYEGEGPKKLIEELKQPHDSAFKPSDPLQKVMDNINAILTDYNQTKFPPLPLVDANSKTLLDFLERLEFYRTTIMDLKPMVTDTFISTFGIVPAKL